MPGHKEKDQEKNHVRFYIIKWASRPQNFSIEAKVGLKNNEQFKS